ncbi:MAG: F0F1 ATP synthase subunit epsilon [Hyphomicrobium sp.]
MAIAFKFELVCPEKVLLSMEADSVVVPGIEGNITVLAQHAPVITALRPGLLEVEKAGTKKRLFVKSGFADINSEALIILAETAFDVAEVSSVQISNEIKIAEGELEAAKDDETKLLANSALACLRSLTAKVAA